MCSEGLAVNRENIQKLLVQIARRCHAGGLCRIDDTAKYEEKQRIRLLLKASFYDRLNDRTGSQP